MRSPQVHRLNRSLKLRGAAAPCKLKRADELGCTHIYPSPLAQTLAMPDQLVFKAHIRGWETDVRQTRCQFLLEKSDHNLSRALLRPEWKDVLLIPQHWYPAHTPKYETKGWWYEPAEEVSGRICKSCRTFYEIESPVGAKRSRRITARCPKCKHKHLTKVTSGVQRGYTHRSECTITGALRKMIV